MDGTLEGDLAEMQNAIYTSLPFELEPELRRAIVDRLIVDLDQRDLPPNLPHTRAVSRRLGERGYYVVVRGDVDYLGTALKAAPGLLSAKYWKALPDLVQLLFRYRRVGVDVTAEEGILLKTMSEDAPPSGWFVDDIWARSALKFDAALTQHQVEGLLTNLLQTKDRTGDLRPLVARDGNRWRLLPGVI